MKRRKTLFMMLAAMFLAFGLLLPLLTGANRVLGNLLCLMHLPILLCGFVCGPWWGLAVGVITPLLRSLLFGAPPVPTCLFMAAELAVYGFLSGLLYRLLPKKLPFLYVALIVAMLAGRAVNGIVQLLVTGAEAYTLPYFLTTNFANAWLGILVQIVLIPLIVGALTRAKKLPIEK